MALPLLFLDAWVDVWDCSTRTGLALCLLASPVASGSVPLHVPGEPALEPTFAVGTLSVCSLAAFVSLAHAGQVVELTEASFEDSIQQGELRKTLDAPHAWEERIGMAEVASPTKCMNLCVPTLQGYGLSTSTQPGRYK